MSLCIDTAFISLGYMVHVFVAENIAWYRSHMLQENRRMDFIRHSAVVILRLDADAV
jgi:hypothetical protein